MARAQDDASIHGPMAPCGQQAFRVRVEPLGLEFAAAPNVTLLQGAALAGWRLPSACRNGTCRACLCKLNSGVVRYQIEWPGLSAEEKQAGCILPCVACATSDLVIQQPAVLPVEPPA
jgi:ferredoxin